MIAVAKAESAMLKSAVNVNIFLLRLGGSICSLYVPFVKV
jgi:hypothetical protein